MKVARGSKSLFSPLFSINRCKRTKIIIKVYRFDRYYIKNCKKLNPKCPALKKLYPGKLTNTHPYNQQPFPKLPTPEPLVKFTQAKYAPGLLYHARFSKLIAVATIVLSMPAKAPFYPTLFSCCSVGFMNSVGYALPNLTLTTFMFTHAPRTPR